MIKKTSLVRSSGNVYKDAGFNDIEAKNLKLRSQLMSLLVKYIQHEHLTQKEAAKKLCVTQPRISNLMRGKIDLFSSDMLLEMLERAGFPIFKKIEYDTRLFLKTFSDYTSLHPKHLPIYYNGQS
jgi:predicted XRE-type DNA-binding protein